MSEAISHQRQKHIKYCVRLISYLLIPTLIVIASINQTPIAIYGAILISFVVFIVLFFTSKQFRKGYPFVIGVRQSARNVKEEINGEALLVKKVHKGGTIKKVSRNLHRDFYNSSLIRDTYEKIINEKNPKITILHGPSTNKEFIKWAKEKGITLKALKKQPKKNLTCVDGKHVRWEFKEGRKNDIYINYPGYGRYCDRLFRRYEKTI